MVQIVSHCSRGWCPKMKLQKGCTTSNVSRTVHPTASGIFVIAELCFKDGHMNRS